MWVAVQGVRSPAASERQPAPPDLPGFVLCPRLARCPPEEVISKWFLSLLSEAGPGSGLGGRRAMSPHHQTEGLRCFDTQLSPFPHATENLCTRREVPHRAIRIMLWDDMGAEEREGSIVASMHSFICSFIHPPPNHLLSPCRVSGCVLGTGVVT